MSALHNACKETQHASSSKFCLLHVRKLHDVDLHSMGRYLLAVVPFGTRMRCATLQGRESDSGRRLLLWRLL